METQEETPDHISTRLSMRRSKEGQRFDPENPEDMANLEAFSRMLAMAGYGKEAAYQVRLTTKATYHIRTAIVYRTQAQALKDDFEKNNYNAPDEPQFEVAVFSDGKVAQRWLTETGSMVWWDSWEALCNVHIYAHPDYGTKVVWSDGRIEQL